MKRGGSEEAVLVLGSNIEPEHHVPLALDLLAERFDLRAVSPAYRSEAVGGGREQPSFVNLALRIATDCPPRALREACRRLEERLGRRRRDDRHAPRTLDLDVVLLGDRVEAHDTWCLPDPDLIRYPFALVPAADVAPGFVHPLLGTTLAALALELDPALRASVTRVDDGGLADAVRIKRRSLTTKQAPPAGDRGGPPGGR